MRRWIAPAAALGCVGAAASGWYGNAQGVLGFGVGLAGGAFGVAILSWTIRLMSGVSRHSKPGLGVALCLLMAAAKLPLLFFLAEWARRTGPGAFDCFLGAVILVYFAVVIGAALGGSEDETPASHGPSAH